MLPGSNRGDWVRCKNWCCRRWLWELQAPGWCCCLYLISFSNQSTSLWLYKEPTVILNPPWQSSCPITCYRCLNIAWKEIGSHSHCCLPFWLAEGQWWWWRVILTPFTNKITQLRPIIIIVVYYRSHEVLPIFSLLFCVGIRSFCPKKKVQQNKNKNGWNVSLWTIIFYGLLTLELISFLMLAIFSTCKEILKTYALTNYALANCKVSAHCGIAAYWVYLCKCTICIYPPAPSNPP